MPANLSNFWDRLRQVYKLPKPELNKPLYRRTDVPVVQPNVTPPQQQVEQAVDVVEDVTTIRDKIDKARRSNMLLYLTYKGVERFVEPYGYKQIWSGEGSKKEVWCGYCLLHGKIHYFYIDLISKIDITSRPYTPRWIEDSMGWIPAPGYSKSGGQI